jgi:MFS family permease
MALIIEQAKGKGSAMGWYNASFYSALAFGPIIGGGLYELYGLNAPFYFWALLGLAAVMTVSIKVHEPARHDVSLIAASDLQRRALINKGYRATFFACCGVVMWVGIVGGFNISMLPSYSSRIGLSTIDIGLIYLVYGGPLLSPMSTSANRLTGEGESCLYSQAALLARSRLRFCPRLRVFFR